MLNSIKAKEFPPPGLLLLQGCHWAPFPGGEFWPNQGSLWTLSLKRGVLSKVPPDKFLPILVHPLQAFPMPPVLGMESLLASLVSKQEPRDHPEQEAENHNWNQFTHGTLPLPFRLQELLLPASSSPALPLPPPAAS